MRVFIGKKSQSALEYAALIAVLVATTIAASLYIRRASEGRMKEAADVYGGEMLYER